MSNLIVGNNLAPLCFLPNGKLVCYKYGDIIVYNNGKKEKVISIFNNVKEKIAARSRFLCRLLRLGVRTAIAIDGHRIILSIRNVLYELDLDNSVLSSGWCIGKGIRPLQFSHINGISDVEEGIYFGGYLRNQEKKPVCIYHRKGVDDWEVVYTFPEESINHIHNIVADAYRKCLWIFTGDFGEAAAIWMVEKGFKTVKRVWCGNQCWRGCVAFVIKEGLLYATDTPRANNYLYILNPETKELKEIMPLHGSCIYGCQWKDNYVFASTVECNGGDMGLIEKWFGRKRGNGIKDEYVHMLCGNLKDGFHEIYREKKDFLPFTLFQFGVLKFPSGENNGDTLYFQPIATVKNDQKLNAYKINTGSIYNKLK